MKLGPARLGAVALALLLMLALSGARRDDAPPELYVEVAERVAAQLPFDLFLSANEPVTYEIEYGDLLVEEVSQDLTVSLLGLLGARKIEVVARDGAGNETRREYQVEGVDSPRLGLTVPAEVRAGDPLTIVSKWSENGARLIDNEVVLRGARAKVELTGESSKTLLVPVPLAATGAALEVEALLVDEFGRHVRESASIGVLPGAEPVQELNIAASTLAVITPDGRERERLALEAAFAAALEQPQWSEPFLLPIEGRSTSGFALPRRYARGGPVSYHEGADIGAPTGTPIVASNAGVVRVAGFFPIKGGLTVIDHGAQVYSLYFHQSRILVEEGQFVTRGEFIGEVGSTGLSTGPHLHWEMRIAGEPTNPMKWVGAVWP